MRGDTGQFEICWKHTLITLIDLIDADENLRHKKAENPQNHIKLSNLFVQKKTHQKALTTTGRRAVSNLKVNLNVSFLFFFPLGKKMLSEENLSLPRNKTR